MRRVVLLLGLAGVTALAGAAWATTPGWVTYRARHRQYPFSFSHPAEWKARFAGYGTGSYGNPQYLIVALSTEHLHRPYFCAPVPCNPILDSLPPAGVYVAWWENDGPLQPDSKLTYQPGNPTHVGGAFARIVIDPTGTIAGTMCPKSTTGSVLLRIAGNLPSPRPGGRPEVYMHACTNTSNFPRFMSQLLPMLRSVSFRQRLPKASS